MQPLTNLDAVGVPLPDADIDTDQIVPARFMHRRRVDYGRRPNCYAARLALAEN